MWWWGWGSEVRERKVKENKKGPFSSLAIIQERTDSSCHLGQGNSSQVRRVLILNISEIEWI